ncbi:MAG: HNH endonuclease [Pirellulales bacterium]|nr:HNH endonuclease [Pirellulales bacterium]
MGSPTGEELRSRVAWRATHRCEYCLIHEDDTYFGCEVDHIISLKHNGPTEFENLAYACLICNRHKGSDLGSILTPGGPLVRFFNPRIDAWGDHFHLDGSFIRALTEIGEVTARIFGFNTSERIIERQALVARGRFWSP